MTSPMSKKSHSCTVLAKMAGVHSMLLVLPAIDDASAMSILAVPIQNCGTGTGVAGSRFDKTCERDANFASNVTVPSLNCRVYDPMLQPTVFVCLNGTGVWVCLSSSSSSRWCFMPIRESGKYSGKYLQQFFLRDKEKFILGVSALHLIS